MATKPRLPRGRQFFANPGPTNIPDSVLHAVAHVTIDFNDSILATDISSVLRKNGVVDVDSYRKLGRNQLRVATFAATDLEDIVKLTKSIDFVVQSLS